MQTRHYGYPRQFIWMSDKYIHLPFSSHILIRVRIALYWMLRKLSITRFENFLACSGLASLLNCFSNTT